MNRPLLALCLVAVTSCASHETAPGVLQPSAPSAPSAPAQGPPAPAAGAVDADGYLQAVDPFEARIAFKSYSGEMTIVSVSPNGASVKSGDVLLQLDAPDLIKQLAAAKNDLLTAQSSAERAEADARLAEQTDALALRQAQENAQEADDAVKWWDTVDGPQILLEADMALKEARAAADDQQDELDQLKKMYKSEELTNATADIVEKRAVRALEMSKLRLGIIEKQTDKRKTVEYPIAQQKVREAQQSAHYGLEELQIAQTQSAVVRKTGLVSAHAALDDAEKKVSDLEEDQQKLTVHAPFDGVVAYGAFLQGAFQGDAKSLRVGEKAAAHQVLMTLYQPGKLSAMVELTQAKFLDVRPGLPVVLTVEGSGLKLRGECEQGPRTPIAASNGPGYVQTIKLNDVDPQLVPGNRVKVHIEQMGRDESASR